MSLKATNNVETNKYELEIEISAEDFEAAIEKAYLKARKNIAMPGFRKGKAPRKLIEKEYGEQVFFEDAVNLLYAPVVNGAVEESGLELVTRPEVEVTEISKENGVKLKATCITKPEVEVKDYKGIEVEKVVNPVTDEDINKQLDALREKNVTVETVDDRAAENGDDVVIDFEGFKDGVAFEGGKAEHYSLVLGSGSFIPGFEEQVVGHVAGEEFDVNVTFPEEYQATELAGKAAVFKIKLHEVKTKEMPVLDDEFAKDVSEYDTLDELKASIRKGMEEQNEKQASLQVENDLVDQVIGTIEGDIPDAMYESRLDELVRDFEYRLQQQGLKLEMYLQYMGQTMETFRASFKEQAEKQVKIRLALEAVAAQEKIEASQEDFEAEMQRIADAYKMEVEKVKELVSEAEVKKDLAVNKAIDFIKSHANIVEKPAEAEKAADAE